WVGLGEVYTSGLVDSFVDGASVEAVV
ncbi:MAG: hypothetical protein QOK47_1285, partial [Actinomycetota bacterium]|nr:hypothetical protein [Actinomycetota bacterium]